jgi:tetratricopeptide (TPR) repeat protein
MNRRGKQAGRDRGLALVPRQQRLAVMPPSPTQRLFAEALCAQQAGRLEEAQRLCLELLKTDVMHAEALHLLGLVLYAEGRPEVAVRMLERAIAVNAREAAFHSNLGNALHALGRLDEAIDAYTQAIALKPGFADAYYNRANTRRDQERLDEAIADYEQALRLRPEFAEVHCNLGGVLRNRGRLAEAEGHLRAGLRLKPDYPDATNNLAVTLQDLGRLNEALTWFERAAELLPENYDVQYNKAMAHLQAGDFARGWREQEARWKTAKAPRSMPKTQWKGEPLGGERVLLHHECGFGDTIQFMRYAPMVAERGGVVVMDVPANLARLAGLLPGVAEVTITGRALPEFDLHCPMMSLPLAFETVLATIPGKTPYLRVPEEARARVKRSLEWPQHGLRVGVAWSGNPQFPRDQFRSMNLVELRPLLALQEVHFYALQMGAAQKQLEALRADDLAARVVDLSPHIRDMADTAALVENLDLVVTVDTAVAHLAGALEKQVWTMIPASPDWRWLTARSDTPWYPSMRLYRQEKLAEWAPVVERLRQSLSWYVRRGPELVGETR